MSDNASTLSVRDVLSLSTKLAGRMVHARDSGLTLSQNELKAVVKAAALLHERNVPWPAVVHQVIDMLAAQMEAVRLAPPSTEARARLSHLN